jgi:hypothetical protein
MYGVTVITIQTGFPDKRKSYGDKCGERPRPVASICYCAIPARRGHLPLCRRHPDPSRVSAHCLIRETAFQRHDGDGAGTVD